MLQALKDLFSIFKDKKPEQQAPVKQEATEPVVPVITPLIMPSPEKPAKPTKPIKNIKKPGRPKTGKKPGVKTSKK